MQMPMAPDTTEEKRFADLTRLKWPMAPDSAPDMGLINIANKRRLRPKKANDRR